jgi:plastocyanin
MGQAARDYWARHPVVGAVSPGSAAAGGVRGGPAAVVEVRDFRFEHDGNAATPIDTVRIQVGEAVQWNWVEGFHTVTSGEGSQDPSSGLIFDAPSDPSHTEFSFTFDTAETVPYYCAFHEGFVMKGVVIVTAPVGVNPRGDGEAIGFATRPWPNPSSRGVSFRFSLGEGGRVRADVLDARGRHVATLLDREYPAGLHEATWSGRGTTGRVAAGVYLLRLRVPGYVGSREIVLTK